MNALTFLFAIATIVPLTLGGKQTRYGPPSYDPPSPIYGPPPTKPVYIEKPVYVEKIKHVFVEKPVYYEKRIPVPQPYAVPHPVPVPQPYAVPQPIAVPHPVAVAVPQPIEIHHTKYAHVPGLPLEAHDHHDHHDHHHHHHHQAIAYEVPQATVAVQSQPQYAIGYAQTGYSLGYVPVHTEIKKYDNGY